MRVYLPKLRTVVLLLLVLMYCCTAYAVVEDREEQARAAYGAAEKMLNERQWDPEGALAAYTDLMSKYGDTKVAPWASFKVGEALYQMQAYSEAAAVLEMILADYGSNVELAGQCSFVLGKSYLDIGEEAKGIAALYKAEKSTAYTAVDAARLRLSVFVWEKQGLAGKDEDLPEVMYFDPSDRRAWALNLSCLARARIGYGDPTGGLAYYNRVITEYADQKEMCGRAALEVGNDYLHWCLITKQNADSEHVAAALGMLASVATYIPEDAYRNSKAAIAMAERAKTDRKYSSARDILNSLLEKHSSSPVHSQLLLILGQAEIHTRNYEKACEYIEQALSFEESGYTPMALFQLAQTRTTLKQPDKAEEALRKLTLMDRYPHWQAAAYEDLAAMYEKQGKLAEAQDCITQAALLTADSKETMKLHNEDLDTTFQRIQGEHMERLLVKSSELAAKEAAE